MVCPAPVSSTHSRLTTHPQRAYLIETVPVVEVVDPAGTSGEGGEEATLRVGESDAGNELGTIEVVQQVRCTPRTIRWAYRIRFRVRRELAAINTNGRTARLDPGCRLDLRRSGSVTIRESPTAG